MKRQLTASVCHEGNWYVASQGESEEGALANLHEALELYFEPPVPVITPHIHSLEVEISAA